MCEITAYLVQNGKEKIILENVDQVKTQTDEIHLINIFGEEKRLNARMIFYSNTEKKMVFIPL